MLFIKKTEEQIQAEQAMLKEKIAIAQKKVQEVAARKALILQLANEKATLKALKTETKDNIFRRIKAKTSPAIRGFEKKLGAKIKQKIQEKLEQKKAEKILINKAVVKARAQAYAQREKQRIKSGGMGFFGGGSPQKNQKPVKLW